MHKTRVLSPLTRLYLSITFNHRITPVATRFCRIRGNFGAFPDGSVRGFIVLPAFGAVVVDEADSLHEGIDDSGADKGHAPFFKIFG
jgi:hypothetical protein